jgi:hypothetical protein
VGVRRAFRQPGQYRGRILAPIVSLLSLGIVVFFGVFVFFSPNNFRRPHTHRAWVPRLRNLSYRHTRETGQPRRLAGHPSRCIDECTEGRIVGVLSRILVTLLQLRVAGYPKSFSGDRETGGSPGSNQRRRTPGLTGFVRSEGIHLYLSFRP